jgi:hypothetical protein
VQALENAPASLRVAADGWLSANHVRPDEVRHGRFPLGFVQNMLERVTSAEASLAAIRQRAEAWDGLLEAWYRAKDPDNASEGIRLVVRYLLGEDAMGAAQEPATEQGPECATCQERGDFERLCCKGPQASVSALEPTTAEAFATIQRLADEHVDDDEARCLIRGNRALLERRMGAMERAIHLALDEDRCSDSVDEALSEALTDAPPVFTLEEVEQATTPPTWSDQMPNEYGAGYREGFEKAMSAVRQRLAAPRKVTP